MFAFDDSLSADGDLAADWQVETDLPPELYDEVELLLSEYARFAADGVMDQGLPQ